jgi:hypothetical protein
MRACPIAGLRALGRLSLRSEHSLCSMCSVCGVCSVCTEWRANTASSISVSFCNTLLARWYSITVRMSQLKCCFVRVSIEFAASALNFLSGCEYTMTCTPPWTTSGSSEFFTSCSHPGQWIQKIKSSSVDNPLLLSAHGIRASNTTRWYLIGVV